MALIGQTQEKNRNDERIRLTFHHNRIEGTARRSPRVNRATADIFNNYFSSWTDWLMAANVSSKVLVEANVFEADPAKSCVALNIGTTDKLEGYVRTEATC